jgi:hypothetical protein
MHGMGMTDLPDRRSQLTAATTAAVVCVAGWLVVAATPREVVHDVLPPERLEPALSLVSAPFSPGSDVVSLVPRLAGALTVGLVAACLVEFAKLLLSIARLATIPTHLVLVGLQVLLVVDALRQFALDWYGYGLHFVRLAPLSSALLYPDPVPVPPPLLSLAGLAMALLMALGGVVRGARPGAG